MNAQPSSNTIDNVAKAQAAWGTDGREVPDWVLALAEACNDSSQIKAAKRVQVGSSTVSQVLSATYPGDLKAMKQRVVDALMQPIVVCPVLGEISREKCTQWQSLPWGASDSMRVRVYQACRAGCPHARSHILKKVGS
ncbi:MAG: transcriptional regulator [Pseudomonadota bacterium]